MAESQDGTVRLADGRALGFAQWGDPVGDPVLSFHGSGTSRLLALGGEERASDFGLRVIGVDRPGFGLSDAQPGRTMLDWPGDVSALADQLGLDHFAVVGVSAGGPYGLVCGAAIAGWVVSVGVVAGVLPTEWYPDDELVALAASDIDAQLSALQGGRCSRLHLMQYETFRSKRPFLCDIAGRGPRSSTTFPSSARSDRRCVCCEIGRRTQDPSRGDGGVHDPYRHTCGTAGRSGSAR